MNMRKIGPFTVNAIGLGCMGMSHGYGKPNKENAIRTLKTALDIGYNFFDTAALYGFGENERLLGDILSPYRKKFILASKCGLIRGTDGKRCLDARPSSILRTCEDSLRNLKTDHIDLYYLHRVDPKVPLDDQIGALVDLVQQGKIISIGLSEVSESTLHKANAIHRIDALQSEYSLWTRTPEKKIISTCQELGITFVAFSPLGRGFLTGHIKDNKDFFASDLRLSMPRFSDENLPKNLSLLQTLQNIAASKNSTLAQVALAWILNKHSEMVPIPGTTDPHHLIENFNAQKITLNQDDMNQLEKAFHLNAIFGTRYDQVTMSSMETE